MELDPIMLSPSIFRDLLWIIALIHRMGLCVSRCSANAAPVLLLLMCAALGDLGLGAQ